MFTTMMILSDDVFITKIMVIIQYNLVFLFALLMEFMLINGYSVFYLERVC